jgi:transcriptional regulator with XRE-family HTH domain
LYPSSLNTLGDYLRKTRLDLNLTQEYLAKGILKTSIQNVSSWEDNRHSISLRFRPKVIEFIGFCPFNASLPLGLRLRERRENFGLSVKRLAQLLGVNPCTITSWEQCQHQPQPKSFEIIKGFLKSVSVDKIPNKDS